MPFGCQVIWDRLYKVDLQVFLQKSQKPFGCQVEWGLYPFFDLISSGF